VTTDPAGAVEDLPPLITVVKGQPTPEQLAALVAVVASLRPVAGEEEDAAAPPTTEGEEPALWGRPAVRTSPPAGPGAWRASGLPGHGR
jgi:hypothetical protein